MRIHRRPVVPLTDEDEAIRGGDRRRERVPRAPRLSEGVALNLGERGDQLVPAAADAEQVGDREDRHGAGRHRMAWFTGR